MAGLTLRLVRTKADAVDDDDPNTTPPSAGELLTLSALRADTRTPTVGLRGVLIFTAPGGNTADVEIWIRNETDATWQYAGVLSGVGSGNAFIHDDIGDAVVFVRLTNITAGNPISVYAQEA